MLLDVRVLEPNEPELWVCIPERVCLNVNLIGEFRTGTQDVLLTNTTTQPRKKQPGPKSKTQVAIGRNVFSDWNT